jgi:hypothetical protein
MTKHNYGLPLWLKESRAQHLEEILDALTSTDCRFSDIFADGHAERGLDQLHAIGTACGIDPDTDLGGIMTWAEFVAGETCSTSDVLDLCEAIMSAIREVAS